MTGEFKMFPDALERRKPDAWFVKDFADGWIYFDDEAAARREAAATGAALMIAYKEKKP